MDTAERETAVRDVLRRAKALAVEYYELTGKPLGVTGEVAELEAASLLDLKLEIARTAHYDARREMAGAIERFQIKGRAVSRNDRYRGRVSAIKCDGDFEHVLLVLLDHATFDAIEIWQAGRLAVAARLDLPGSKARNERRSLAISQFKSIARRVWPLQSASSGVPATALSSSASRPVSASMTPPHGGQIGSLISELLMSRELDYAEIVRRVKLTFPHANTSTKSVASTARDLRRHGTAVPSRSG